MERYICSVHLSPIRNFSVYDASLMTTDDEIPQFIIQFKDSLNHWFEDFATFPNRTELVELLCLPNHPILMKGLCEKPGKLPGVIRFYLHSLFFEAAAGTVSRNELELQQVLQNFLAAFGSKVFVEPSINLQFSIGVYPSLPKQKNNLKFTIQPERHIAKEQIDSAQKVMEVLTRTPAKFFYNRGLQVSEKLFFWNGELTETPPVEYLENNKAILMYTKGFGRRRSLAQVCESIMSGAMDAGTKKESSNYFHRYGLLNAPHSVLILSKDENVEKWASEIDDSFIISNDEDFDLIDFQLLLKGATIILGESAFRFIADKERYAAETVQEIFARESTGIRYTRTSLDAAKSRRFYVGNIAQRHTHAVIPLTYAHYRLIIADQGTEAKVAEFSTDFTLYNSGYASLIPLYPEQDCIKLIDPHSHRIFNDSNSGMIIKSMIPQTMVRKICFLPSAILLQAQEKKFINRMQRIASTRSMVNRFLDITDILLGGEYNDISGCVFSLALPRLTSMSKESAILNLKKHFSLLNGTLGQRLLSDFGVLDEDFASRSYVQENLQKGGSCCVCFNEVANVLTLCGHSLCSECKSMLADEEQLLFKCPTCRSSLTHYDFIEFGDVEVIPQPCSKFVAIEQTLDALFSRRRTKKRAGANSSKKALIVATSKSLINLKLQLTELERFSTIADWDMFNTSDTSKNRVFITTFETFNSLQIDDSLEGILLACPSAKTDFYFDLIKSCKQRTFSLPLHIFFAQGVEEITETIECLVNIKN